MLKLFSFFPQAHAAKSCIELIAAPGHVVTWDEFQKYPSYSIGLDGYVSAPTRRDPGGPRANFDHHKGADRLSTRSTADQVAMEIRFGLFESFRRDGQPYAKVFVNDCDEDTCLAVWLLRNQERVCSPGEPLIDRLIFFEDRLDCTGGMYAFREVDMLRQVAWVFEPYHEARASGRLQSMTSEELTSVIDTVGERITRYAAGQAERIELQGSFNTLGGGPGWTLISSAGPFARMSMAQHGIQAYVLSIGEGRFTLGRASEWIPFPIEKLYEILNAAEPPGVVTETNRWGGSNTIGGSPRDTGSSLSGAQIEALINKYLATQT